MIKYKHKKLSENDSFFSYFIDKLFPSIKTRLNYKIRLYYTIEKMEKLYKYRKNIKWKKLFIMMIYVIGI